MAVVSQELHARFYQLAGRRIPKFRAPALIFYATWPSRFWTKTAMPKYECEAKSGAYARSNAKCCKNSEQPPPR